MSDSEEYSSEEESSEEEETGSEEEEESEEETGEVKRDNFQEEIMETQEVEETEEVEEVEETQEDDEPQKSESLHPEEQKIEAPTAPKLSVPRITPPKIPDGDVIDLEDIHRKRMEKDLAELQTLINAHFEQRKKDEDELETLRHRIEVRKEQRAEQARVRQEREKERMAKERDERKKKEEEEETRRVQEEERKKAQIANMSLHYGGYLARAEKNKPNKRQTEREKKRKHLADRRKPLNIDHLNQDKLREKATELWEYLFSLEDEKYDFEQRINRQKYDINQLRQRVNEYMGKFNKAKRGAGKVKIVGHGGVGNVAATFK